MSQAENAAATSSKPKRAYRKGNPLTSAEKKRLSTERKKATHKILNMFIKNESKDELLRICEETGLTQAEVIEVSIRHFLENLPKKSD